MSDVARPPQSFLMVDCGTTRTSALLFDRAAETYHLIARGTAATTANAPWADVIFGIQHAITQITHATGRPLLNDEGELMRPMRATGAGVDYFGLSASAARPLRTVTVGLLDEVSLASARQALSAVYATEVTSISLADARDERAQIDAIRRADPDLVLIVGGTDGGRNQRLIRLLETVAAAISLLDGDSLPDVLFAGNRDMRDDVAAILAGLATIHVADNVRPALDIEQPDDAAFIIQEIFRRRCLQATPGITDLSRWGAPNPTPTAEAMEVMLRYFAVQEQGPVMAVDLGASSAALFYATPERTRRAVRADLGMGLPLPDLLQRVPAVRLRPYLPPGMSGDDLRDFVAQKALLPGSLPTTAEDLATEQALARATLWKLHEDAARMWRLDEEARSRPRLLIGRGRALTGAPRPAQALLMMLDALQPTGVFKAALDVYDALPALGLLARRAPVVTVQSLENNVLLQLGWVVAPAGRGQPGQRALQVRLHTDDGSRLEVDVAFGQLEVLPLPMGSSAELTLLPGRRFDVGSGPGRRRKVTISGGAAGLVIDARGRPLSLPREIDAAQRLVVQWQKDIGG